MTMMPTYITIDERMKRGLASPLQPAGDGVWFHQIPDSDIVETVYDPRAGWQLTGDFFKQLVRGPQHVGRYFPPGAPLPQPTGRSQDLLDRSASDDPRNWRFTGWSKAEPARPPLPAQPAGVWGEFEWIGPKLATQTPSALFVPRERMHEMVGARGMGDVDLQAIGIGVSGVVAVGLVAWWLWNRSRR
jgi:hypothetical protein